MNFKKLMTNNRLLVKLIISYLITSILLTSILLTVVSQFVSKNTEKNIRNSAKSHMRQSYNTAYYALTDIYGDFYLLWSKDKDILRGLTSSQISQEEVESIIDSIDNTAFRDNLVHSVYLINKKADLVISNVSTPSSIENFYDLSALELFEDFNKHYDAYKNEVFFPRKTSYSLGNTDYTKEYISIVYTTRDTEGEINSGLIVNIDQNKLSSMLNNENESTNMIIANGSGKIISDSQGQGFATDLLQGKTYKSIANNVMEEDSFIGEYLGEKSFITYKKANNIGFVFISITPYSYLSNEVSNIEKTIGGFFLVAMFVSLLVSIFATKKIYSPLDDLIKKMRGNPLVQDAINMDEYTFLGETYNSLILKDKSSQVSKIFNGNYGDETEEVLRFTKEKYISFAIVPDDDSFRNTSFLTKIINIVNSHTNWYCAITSNECVSCIINEDSFDEKKLGNIMEDMVNFQDIILEDLDTTVSIGIGTDVNSIDSMRFSHRYALNALNYAHSLGENQIVLYSEIENSKVAASVNKDSIADKVEKYVLDNYTRQDFSVEEVADVVDLSLGYIRRIFKNEKQITLNEFLICCRINKAKELLIKTEDTAKDIAEKVGYYDNRYFYTLFKKRVGMTTEEFRNSGRGEEANEG